MKPKALLQGLALPFVLLVLWEVGGRLAWWQPNILPTPSDVVLFIVQSVGDGSLFGHIGATLARLVLGFVLGLAAGTGLGLLTGMNPLALRLVDPLIQAFRAIPSLAWVPLFLVWLGIGELSKIALIAVGVFFPLYLNLVAGIHGVDRKLIEVGRTYGLKPAALVRRIVLPAAFPAFLTGVRGGLGLGWMFVVAAELIGASQGLGYLLDYGRNIARPDMIIASILLFAVLGKATDALLVAVEKRTLVWQDTVLGRG